MEEESIRRPYNRRRIMPHYSSTEDLDEKQVNVQKVRDPFTALQEAEEKAKIQRQKQEESTAKPAETTTVNPRLKAVLKQTGGMSLSELLQRKNLTLSELLKGSPDVLSVITDSSEAVAEVTAMTETSKYRRKNINRHFESESASSEVVAPQKNRLSLLHRPAEHKTITSTPPDVDLIKSTTVKPSQFEEITTEATNLEPTVITSTAADVVPKGHEILTNRISLKPRLKAHLPTTLAKLNEIKQKNPTTEKVNPEDDKDAGPLKITIDIENVINKTEREDFPIKPVQEKLKTVTAAEELMEILKDSISRERLSRILELRNMTIEELIAQRERGSSQLHLADIFHSQKREPEPKEEPLIGEIKPYPIHQERSKYSVLPSHAAKNMKGFEFGDKIVASSSETPKVESDVYTVTSFPTYKIEMDKSNKEGGYPQFFPVWKSIVPTIYADVHEDYSQEAKSRAVISKPVDLDDADDLQRIEDVENKIAESVNEKLNVDLNQNYYEEENFTQITTGVKSAIVASAVIVGASLLVFLTIFGVFRWTQKQKRSRYSNSFAGTKSPILEAQKRSFRTLMTETLGRKKPQYQQYFSNMSDSSWESDSNKKPYQ